MDYITDETPIAMITVGQLREILSGNLANVQQVPIVPTSQRENVYGLRGIAALFGVSTVTAQQYKNTFLKPAIKQNGRKIIIDRDRAVELWTSRTHGKGIETPLPYK